VASKKINCGHNYWEEVWINENKVWDDFNCCFNGLGA
jgi:hypothetical protein